MKVIEIFLQHQKRETIHQDNCSTCISKLCCVVFDILDERNQGRNHTLIKESGVPCQNLGHDGECCIYKTRDDYPGYSQNCSQYTCHNIGPLIDGWMQKNTINLNQQSRNIALLMRQCIFFVTTGNRYEERYGFLKEVLLEEFIDPKILYEHISSHWYQIDRDFQEWFLSLPEHQECMKKLRIGLG